MPDKPLPLKAALTTPDQPWPVRLLSKRMAEYIDKMSEIWVEGQVVQLNRRPGTTMAFLTLRDTDLDMSLPVTIFTGILDKVDPELTDGAHIVVHAKPRFYEKRGTLSLSASEIRPVGIGELLARIEELKNKLDQEGLFDLDRKVPLPFLPTTVGLVCGVESKAEHDVVVNAQARWPQVRFIIKQVSVQGPKAVTEVSNAIEELDHNPKVEVIVVARGGGSVEDLLPFSNERLVRMAAACVTPLVSAIGHETDRPLLDLVADYRASTPTDAAKRIVPDMAAERLGLSNALTRMRRTITYYLEAQAQILTALRARPVLAQPSTMITMRAEQIASLVETMRRTIDIHLREARSDLAETVAHLRALSPLATLERGYAIVQGKTGIIRDASDVGQGDAISVRLARATIDATVNAVTPTEENTDE